MLALVEDPALVSGVGHGIHQGVPANIKHEEHGPLVMREQWSGSCFVLRMVDQDSFLAPNPTCGAQM